VAHGVAPPGLVHRPFAAIVSITSRVVIGSPDSASTFAAASRALIFPAAFAFFVLSVALANFLAAGFFVAVVFVVFFADMVVLPFSRFAAPPAESRRISGVATGHHEPSAPEHRKQRGKNTAGTSQVSSGPTAGLGTVGVTVRAIVQRYLATFLCL
jgi:hypothetical protein